MTTPLELPPIAPDALTAAEQVEAIRDLFPRCVVCGGFIASDQLAEQVVGRSRVRHARCVS